MSEGDYEDESDDDLFAEFVDTEVREVLSSGLVGGVENRQPVEGEVPVEQVVVQDPVVGEGDNEDYHLANDEDLNDTDEELNSPAGSDDEGGKYPVFNPDVDFKHKINLTVGLKFPSNKVFRKALRHHQIDAGYNYYFLHNKSHRVSVYCKQRCGCPRKAGRMLKCTCT